MENRYSTFWQISTYTSNAVPPSTEKYTAKRMQDLFLVTVQWISTQFAENIEIKHYFILLNLIIFFYFSDSLLLT